MAQPMLSLDPAGSSAQKKTTPHLLSCRVHHTGSVEPIASFWNPTQSEDGSHTAYFRGRKLAGKAVKLPEGYRGVVAAQKKAKAAEEESKDDGMSGSRRSKRSAAATAAAAVEQGAEGVQDELAEVAVPEARLEVQAEFDQFIVWGHETTAGAAGDAYVRGVEEWLVLADKIHSYPAEK